MLLNIHSVLLYFTKDGDIVNENFTVASEASDHSRVAALSCWLRVLSCLCEKYPDLLRSLTLHIWSDGCAGHFRSRFVFHLLTIFALEHTLYWYYNERHHGKGQIDGIIKEFPWCEVREVQYRKCGTLCHICKSYIESNNICVHVFRRCVERARSYRKCP